MQKMELGFQSLFFRDKFSTVYGSKKSVMRANYFYKHRFDK